MCGWMDLVQKELIICSAPKQVDEKSWFKLVITTSRRETIFYPKGNVTVKIVHFPQPSSLALTPKIYQIHILWYKQEPPGQKTHHFHCTRFFSDLAEFFLSFFENINNFMSVLQDLNCMLKIQNKLIASFMVVRVILYPLIKQFWKRYKWHEMLLLRGVQWKQWYPLTFSCTW